MLVTALIISLQVLRAQVFASAALYQKTQTLQIL